MKVLYIEARSKTKGKEFFIDPSFIKTLPKRVFLTYSIQFKSQAEAMKKALMAKNIAVEGFQQVLGCSKLKVKENIPIILVGQGRFHALNLAIQNNRPIILYSNGSSMVIGEKELKEHEKKKEASANLFLHAKSIGIIVTSKPGQENLKLAEDIKEKIMKKYPEKKVFLFISGNINVAEFENFHIDFWINTACPGISINSPRLANPDDIHEFL